NVRRRDPPDIVGPHAERCTVLGLPGAPVVPECDVAHACRQTSQVLLLPAPGCFETMAGSRELLGCRPVAGQLAERPENRLLELGLLDAGRRLDLEQELPSPVRAILSRVDPGREFPALHELVPQPRSPAAS